MYDSATLDRIFDRSFCSYTFPSSALQNRKLEQWTEYKASDLKDCVRAIHDLQSQRRAASLVAVSEKYKQNKVTTTTLSFPQ